MAKKFYGVHPVQPLTPIQIEGDDSTYQILEINYLMQKVLFVKAGKLTHAPFSKIRFAKEMAPDNELVLFGCPYCGKMHQQIVDACTCSDDPFEYGLWVARPLDEEQGQC